MAVGTTTTEVLVAGAGMAGLMAARVLQEQGIDVTLVEKNDRVGGRLATCAVGPGLADCGAQFFTARSDTFQVWVDQWLADDLVHRWSTGWSDGSVSPTMSDGHPRYVAWDGMQSLAEHLAGGLEIHLDTDLVSVTLAEGGWRSEARDGRVYTSLAVLLTPPVPESLVLLDAGRVDLSHRDRRALGSIRYAPSLTALFWVEGAVKLPEPGAIQRPYQPINWIADNRRKGISPDATTITVQADPGYSQEMQDLPDEEVLAVFQASIEPYMHPTATIRAGQLWRWRYALPTALHADPLLVAADLPPLVFAGDAFGSPRLEGAALSGLAAGKLLAATIAALDDR